MNADTVVSKFWKERIDLFFIIIIIIIKLLGYTSTVINYSNMIMIIIFFN